MEVVAVEEHHPRRTNRLLLLRRHRSSASENRETGPGRTPASTDGSDSSTLANGLRSRSNAHLRRKISQEELSNDSRGRECSWLSTPSSGARSLAQFLREAFLPQGFPESVRPDYVPYQIFDTLQAFCSNITGLLATRAVLKGAGVGNAEATATAATLTWVLQDGMGMIGRILFAWKTSFSLDADCKQWRFAADILNDFAALVDVLAPSFPRSWFVFLACVATLSRSLCGVAGGSTKAALSQHFAARGNMADLNAKDGNQETIVGLAGMLIGSLVVHHIPDDSELYTSFCFITFTVLHLAFNYLGVSAVILDVFNTQRANIVISSYKKSGGRMLSPTDASKREAILFAPRERIHLGVSLRKVLDHWCSVRTYPPLNENDFSTLVAAHVGLTHLLSYDSRSGRVFVALSEDATPIQILQAYFHAHIVLAGLQGVTGESTMREAISATCVKLPSEFQAFVIEANSKGWNIDDSRNLLRTSEYRYNLKIRQE
ncbi:DUF647 family protein [Zopfochytrium polystomum]|nr:DUF647 family protein [Zopfochytrium polystomum]